MVISIHAPLTGSDPVCSSIVRFKSDFNPRSPYGERPIYLGSQTAFQKFQSTLPLRGATSPSRIGCKSSGISIHAPLTGSDSCQKGVSQKDSYFNPRSPYGERLRNTQGNLSKRNFNPRSPYGERLPSCGQKYVGGSISIHAPLTGSDVIKPCSA